MHQSLKVVQQARKEKLNLINLLFISRHVIVVHKNACMYYCFLVVLYSGIKVIGWGSQLNQFVDSLFPVKQMGRERLIQLKKGTDFFIF